MSGRANTCAALEVAGYEAIAPVAGFLPGHAAEAASLTGLATSERDQATAQPWRVLGILSALMGFASISTDLYLPAMPAMGKALDAPVGSIELTVSGFLIGFSSGQLFWGPISDRYGRRVPVATGLALFVIGSAGCAMAGSAEAMIGWRIVQAVGACAGVVLGRAMVRDLYSGARAAQMLSTLMTVMAIAPLLGPIVGGQILMLDGWRAIFWMLVVVGIATLASLFTLQETLPPGRRNRQPLMTAFLRYGELLRHRRLLAYAGAGGFFYGGMYAYIAGSPFAYITYHHVPAPLYGLLFALGILGIMATNMLNVRLVMSFGVDRLLNLRKRIGCGRERRSGGRRPDGSWRPHRASGAALPVRLCGGVHRRQFDGRRHGRFPGARRRSLGPRRSDPLRQRHSRIGAGRRVRRRHPLADGLGDRCRRARKSCLCGALGQIAAARA